MLQICAILYLGQNSTKNENRYQNQMKNMPNVLGLDSYCLARKKRKMPKFDIYLPARSLDNQGYNMLLGLGFEYKCLIIEYNWHVELSLANGDLKIYRNMHQLPGWWPRSFLFQ